MLKTPITELFGIKHPVMCGGMTGYGTAPLISAVANAGGLGCLTGLMQPTPEALGEEIERTRALTDQPFGVNLTILPTINPVPYDAYRQVIIDTGVTIVETAGSNPAPHVEAFKEAGIKVIHKATSVRHALRAVALGVDAVTIDGFECAGHPGEDDVTNLVLIPAAAEQITIPMIASGGFANGRGLAAALALGAHAINMGTRFIATSEAPVHENVKQQVVTNSELDSVLVFRKFHNTARVARNAISEEIVRRSDAPDATFADIAELAAGARGRERVLAQGVMDDGMWWAGMSQGLIHEVAPVKDVIEKIVADAETIISRTLPGYVA